MSCAFFSNEEVDTELQEAYEILSLPIGSPLEEVERAFRDEAQLCHPDRFSDLAESVRERAEARFKIINEAYQTIQDFTERFGNYSAQIPTELSSDKQTIATAVNSFTSELKDQQDRYFHSLWFWLAVSVLFFVIMVFSAVTC